MPNVVTDTGVRTPIAAATLKGYQAEGQRINQNLQSQAANNAAWTKSNLTATEDTTVAPDGTTTADTITASAGNTSHQHYNTAGLTASAAAYTVSRFLKAGTVGWAGLAFQTRATVDGAFFNLSTGVVGTVAAGVTAAIEPAANGFYRCSITKTLDAVAGTWYNVLEPHTADNQSDTWNAAGTETIISWGSQFELGSFASSYIPTTTVAVTRNADVLTYATSGNVIGTVGTLYHDVTISDWTLVSNRRSVSYEAALGTPLYLSNATSGIAGYDGLTTVLGPTGTPTGTMKFGISYGNSALIVAANGSTTSGTFDNNMNIAATFRIGGFLSGAGEVFGNIKNVKQYAVAQTAAQLAAATA